MADIDILACAREWLADGQSFEAWIEHAEYRHSKPLDDALVDGYKTGLGDAVQAEARGYARGLEAAAALALTTRLRDATAIAGVIRRALKDAPAGERDPLKPWRDLAAEQGWNKVECIECELGRDCDKHRKEP